MAAAARAAAPVFQAVRRYLREMLLPSFRGSYSASQRVNVIMPLGVTYFALMLRFTIAGVAATEAQIKAQINRIRCIIDGDTKIDASPTELLAIFNFWNARHGLTNVVDGVFRLELGRPWDQETDAQDGPAWGCATNVAGGVSNFTLEIEWAGSGVTIDNVDGWAEVGPATPLGRHFCLRRYPDSQAASGDKVFSDFTMQPEASMYALHIDKGSVPEALAPISHLKLVVDQVTEMDLINTGALDSLHRKYGLTKQTGYTHLAFARRGRPLEALPLVAQDMRLTIRSTTALSNFNILCEQQEGVDPA